MSEYRQGSIFIRQAAQLLETGAVVEGHKHNFDHTTFFSSGLWKVECFGDVFDSNGKVLLDANGRPQRVKLREVTIRGGAPHAFLLIDADKYHTLTLLEGPGCYACLFSHRTTEGEVTPEYTGWHAAYE